MIDREVLKATLQRLGVDWIGQGGFLDEGQINHVLDIMEERNACR